ncbi:MAG: hypothetical protein LCH52_08570 [Bacteroidetes bacterium]|nr:hypothetical protein [Bacteroidota bacterium]
MSTAIALDIELSKHILYTPAASPQVSNDTSFISGSLYEEIVKVSSRNSAMSYNEVIGSQYLIGYFDKVDFINSVESLRKYDNIKKLIEFGALEHDWDNEGGKKIPKTTIRTVYNIVKSDKLIKQPFIAPLPTGGILLTLRISKTQHMNIFLRDESTYNVVEIVKRDGNIESKEYKINHNTLLQQINMYYANNR